MPNQQAVTQSGTNVFFAHPLVRMCPSPAADRRCACAFIDVLGSHPPGMNAIFWEIGTRKSLSAKVWMFPLSAKSEFAI